MESLPMASAPADEESTMRGRTPIQCFQSDQETDSEDVNESKESSCDNPHPSVRVKWTKAEDELLMSLVATASADGKAVSWTEVASHMPNRSKRQVHGRWSYSLKDTIRKGRFSADEDKKLLNAIGEVGQDFPRISREVIPWRTSVQLRDRYNTAYLRPGNKVGSWSREEDVKLYKTVQECGDRNWSQVVKQLPGRTRATCRFRYKKIIKELEAHPGKTVEDVPIKRYRKTKRINQATSGDTHDTDHVENNAKDNKSDEHISNASVTRVQKKNAFSKEILVKMESNAAEAMKPQRGRKKICQKEDPQQLKDWSSEQFSQGLQESRTTISPNKEMTSDIPEVVEQPKGIRVSTRNGGHVSSSPVKGAASAKRRRIIPRLAKSSLEHETMGD